MFATSGFAAAALLSALAIGYMEHRDKRKASRKWEEQQVVERVDNEKWGRWEAFVRGCDAR